MSMVEREPLNPRTRVLTPSDSGFAQLGRSMDFSVWAQSRSCAMLTGCWSISYVLSSKLLKGRYIGEYYRAY